MVGFEIVGVKWESSNSHRSIRHQKGSELELGNDFIFFFKLEKTQRQKIQEIRFKDFHLTNKNYQNRERGNETMVDTFVDSHFRLFLIIKSTKIEAHRIEFFLNFRENRLNFNLCKDNLNINI